MNDYLTVHDGIPESAQPLFFETLAKYEAAGELRAYLKAYRALEEAGYEHREGQWVEKGQPDVSDVHIDKPLGSDEEDEAKQIYTPPVEVIEIAKAAAEPDEITKAMACRALTEAEVRQVAGTAAEGSLTAKWAARILRKLDRQPSFEIAGTVVKLDESQHLVFGWFSVTQIDGRPVTDTQGDQITAETLEQSAYRFVLDAREAGEMHRVRGVGRLVESCVFTPEKQAAMRESLKEQGIDAKLDLGCVAWWGGMHIDSEDVWQKITTGQLRAWSLGGRGERQKIAA